MSEQLYRFKCPQCGNGNAILLKQCRAELFSYADYYAKDPMSGLPLSVDDEIYEERNSEILGYRCESCAHEWASAEEIQDAGGFLPVDSLGTFNTLTQDDQK